MTMRILLGTHFAAGLLLLANPAFMQTSHAGSPVIVVDDAVVPVAPDGQCSLIEAFENAVDEAGTHADCPAGSEVQTTIQLAADSSYTLTTVHNSDGGTGPNGLPLLAGDIVVQGQGATIQRGGSTPPFRILEVAAGGVVELQDLSIQSGSLGDPGQSGSGIRSEGSLSLSHVSMSGHSGAGAGGAIYSEGDLDIAHSTFQGNGGGGPGGAVFNAFGGTASIEYSTLAGNSCGGGGCGLQNEGTAELANTTISGSGGPNAGGIQNMGTLTLTHVTLALNGGASGGDLTNNGSAVMRNTLVASPNTGSACAGVPPVFEGVNIIQDDTCGCSGTAGCTVSDPGLGSLQDNGGATDTHAIESGSSAVDAADAAHCLADDQRGISRPQGDGCDVGAYESEFIADPQLGVAPSTIDFGNVMVGLNSPPQAAVVSNEGNVELTGLSVGVVPGDFELVSSDCDPELSPGDQCQVVIRFQPQSEQAFSESMAVSSNETGTTSLMLQGVGIPFVDSIFGDRFDADN